MLCAPYTALLRNLWMKLERMMTDADATDVQCVYIYRPRVTMGIYTYIRADDQFFLWYLFLLYVPDVWEIQYPLRSAVIRFAFPPLDIY